MKGMGQIVSWSVRDESLHCEAIIKLFHTFARETNCLTQGVKDDIVDCCKTVVGLEDKFIELAFGMGPVNGMTPEDIQKYIRYVADWRLGQLGLPAVYDIKEHPLPWLQQILNGVVAADDRGRESVGFDGIKDRVVHYCVDNDIPCESSVPLDRFRRADGALDDVALIKALRGDRWGNLIYRKAARNFSPIMATAARCTIAQVDEIVELGTLDPETVVTPGIFVSRVLAVGSTVMRGPQAPASPAKKAD